MLVNTPADKIRQKYTDPGAARFLISNDRWFHVSAIFTSFDDNSIPTMHSI